MNFILVSGYMMNVILANGYIMNAILASGYMMNYHSGERHYVILVSGIMSF